MALHCRQRWRDVVMLTALLVLISLFALAAI